MVEGKVAAAGVVGAAGGFSVAALFRSIDLAEILGDHSRQPAFIFGIVAIFCILATILSILVRPPQTDHRHYIKYAILLFGLIALVCVVAIVREAMIDPSVRIFARFQPDLSQFKDPDNKDPIRLSLTYIEPHQTGAQGTEKMFGNGLQMAEMLKSNETIDLHYQGLSRLADKYTASTRNNHLLQKELVIACKHASKDVCALLNAQMEDSIGDQVN